MVDHFEDHMPGLESPAAHAFDAYAARSNSTDFEHAARALYTGSGGDIKVTTTGGDTVILPAIPPGNWVPIRVARVWSTGTTATSIIGIW